MSRSRRKNAGCGVTTAASDKPFKQREHRRERMALRATDLTAEEPKGHRLFGNPWHGDKDGKQWFDQDLHPERMRQ